MKNRVPVYSVLLGFSSAVMQVLVMRSLAAALYGNELIFVLVLAGWLVGVAAGSLCFGFFLPSSTDWRRVALRLLLVSAVAAPSTILAARFVRNLFGATPGVLMDLVPVSVAVLLVVFPVSFLLGALFPVLSGWSRSYGVPGAMARVYALESVGFVVGGVVATAVFLPWLDALSTACVVFGLHVLSVAVLGRRSAVLTLLVAAALAFLLLGGYVPALDWSSQAAQWKGFRVVDSRDSVYGNLQLLEKDGEKSLFENGVHVATTGDALTSEENVHYALLAHPAPVNVLIVGGGLAGSLAEALKYPFLALDYVELDPAAIEVVRQNIPKVDRAMDDPRIKVIASDGRRYIRHSPRQYDVVILNLSDPLTLLVNRYYTVESLQDIRRRLAPGGILSFSVSSSDNYLNREGREYLGVLRSTLREVFAEVRSIPGDRNIFLASMTKGAINISPDVLSARLKERGIRTRFVRDHYFNFRLDPVRVDEFERSLPGSLPVNKDERPSAFLAALLFWSTHFHSGLSQTVELFRRFGWGLAGLPLLVWGALRLGRQRRVVAAGFIVGVTGLCLMVYQLAVLIALQSFYGYVYSGIGLVTAAFMAGVFGGSRAVAGLAGDAAEIRQRRIALYSAVFAALVGCMLPGMAVWSADVAVLGCLTLVSLGAGYLGGAQFSLAGKHAGDDVRNAGILYALDVAGAALGGLLAGLLLVPWWGIGWVGCWCAFLQLAILAGLRQPAR